MAEDFGTLAKSISQSKFLSCPRDPDEARRRQHVSPLCALVTSTTIIFKFVPTFWTTPKTGRKLQQTSAEISFASFWHPPAFLRIIAICSMLVHINEHWLKRRYFVYKLNKQKLIKTVFFSKRKVWLPGLAGKLSPELWTLKEWPHQCSLQCISLLTKWRWEQLYVGTELVHEFELSTLLHKWPNQPALNIWQTSRSGCD